MKKYLAGFLFLLLCYPQSVAAEVGRAHFVAKPGGQTLAEYIDSLSIENTTEFALDTEFKNTEVPPNIARLVNLRQIHIAEHSQVSKAEYLDSLQNDIEFSQIPAYNQRIVLPQELFTLPSLEALYLGGLAQYRLKSPLLVDEVKTNIRILCIKYPYKETINFWPVFQNLEILDVDASTIPKFEEVIYSFKNLTDLSITRNAVTIHFDERLNGLNKLESIDLKLSSATWPKDMSGMSNLKEITFEDCAYAPERIGWWKYYFPAGIHSLPNLETLRIFPYGPLELPPRKTGLTKLKELIVNYYSSTKLRDSHYLPCQPDRLAPAGADVLPVRKYAIADINNITDYSSLEAVAIATGDAEKDIELARKIRAAYQDKEMPDVKLVVLYPDYVFATGGKYKREEIETIDIIDEKETKDLLDNRYKREREMSLD